MEWTLRAGCLRELQRDGEQMGEKSGGREACRGESTAVETPRRYLDERRRGDRTSSRCQDCISRGDSPPVPPVP